MLSNTIIPYHDGVYEGSITNGVPNGWGKLTYFHDVVYEGEWRNGQEHGKGTITWWNGCSFTGSFEEGKPISTCKHFLTHMYELGQRQQQLADMKHDLEELLELLELQKETTQQVQLTLEAKILKSLGGYATKEELIQDEEVLSAFYGTSEYGKFYLEDMEEENWDNLLDNNVDGH